MKYGEKYQGFNSLLLYFLIWGEEYEPVLDDLSIIKKFVLDNTPELLVATIKEGHEILTLDPFPATWIWDIAGGHARPLPSVEITNCKEWIDWVVKTLIKEAIKSGKINQPDF